MKLLSIVNEINLDRLNKSYHFKSLSDYNWQKIINETEQQSKEILGIIKNIVTILNKKYSLNKRVKFDYEYNDNFYGTYIEIGFTINIISNNIKKRFINIGARYLSKKLIDGNYDLGSFKEYYAQIYYYFDGNENPTLEIKNLNLFTIEQIKDKLLKNFNNDIMKAKYFTI